MLKLIYPKFWQTKNLLAYCCLPISLIYIIATKIRCIIIRPIKLSTKVICVGNLTIGGTGKTQIVISLAQALKKQKINFVIVTKGYKGKFKNSVLLNKEHSFLEVGDESIELLEYGKVIATKKINTIIPIINQLKPDVIILDDSMQNPRIIKDFNILVIDTNRGFGNRFFIPAGPMRQSIKSGINQANIVINIGINIQKKNINFSGKNKMFNAIIKPSIKIDKTKKYFLFSGIGNPERFYLMLKIYGLNIIGYKYFPDHHIYNEKDLNFLRKISIEYDACLITTRKDFIKINNKIDIICCNVRLIIPNKYKILNKIYETIFQENQIPN